MTRMMAPSRGFEGACSRTRDIKAIRCLTVEGCKHQNDTLTFCWLENNLFLDTFIPTRAFMKENSASSRGSSINMGEVFFNGVRETTMQGVFGELQRERMIHLMLLYSISILFCLLRSLTKLSSL